MSLLVLTFLAFRAMPLSGQASLNRVPLIQNRIEFANAPAIVSIPIAAMAALLCVALTQTSCGNGGANGGATTGTQAGTYTVGVTATSASDSATDTPKTNLTLTVE
jgi:hypothetical protein